MRARRLDTCRERVPESPRFGVRACGARRASPRRPSAGLRARGALRDRRGSSRTTSKRSRAPPPCSRIARNGPFDLRSDVDERLSGRGVKRGSHAPVRNARSSARRSRRMLGRADVLPMPASPATRTSRPRPDSRLGVRAVERGKCVLSFEQICRQGGWAADDAHRCIVPSGFRRRKQQPLLVLEELEASGGRDGLTTCWRVELAQDGRDVMVDRSPRDDEAIGDLGVS